MTIYAVQLSRELSVGKNGLSKDKRKVNSFSAGFPRKGKSSIDTSRVQLLLPFGEKLSVTRMGNEKNLKGQANCSREGNISFAGTERAVDIKETGVGAVKKQTESGKIRYNGVKIVQTKKSVPSSCKKDKKKSKLRFSFNESDKTRGGKKKEKDGFIPDEKEALCLEKEIDIEKNVIEMQQEMPSVCNAFFSEISKYPLLTPEQEHELALKIRNERDQEAFNLFLMSNMRLALACVRDVMRRMGGNTILDFMDLAQEAVLGLMTAVERFDPERGTRFSTYGLYWIYQRVKRAVVSQRKGLSVPGFAGESVFAMTDYIQLYNQGHEQDIPKRLRSRVRDLARITNSVMSFGDGDMDEQTGRSKPGVVDAERFVDREHDNSNCYLGDEVMSRFFISDFHKFLEAELSKYQADILRRKFGLYPYNMPASHKEIGKVYGKSSETIRLNIESIMKRLKKNKRAKKFLDAWLSQN